MNDKTQILNKYIFDNPNTTSCRFLNEVCFVNNLVIKYDYSKLNTDPRCQQYLCKINISKDNSEIIDIESNGIGKKEARHKVAQICLKSPKLFKYINLKISKALVKYELPQENEYIKWGESIINNEYELIINDITALHKFNGKTIAIDSEGFPEYNQKGYAQIIQIANDKTVAIFDYNKFYKILCPFLKSKKLIMCGATNDLKFLGLNTNNYIDLQIELQQLFTNMPHPLSLKQMASLLTKNKKPFKKPPGKFYCYNNWSIDNLDHYHKIYAAIDAIVTFKIYKNILS